MKVTLFNSTNEPRYTQDTPFYHHYRYKDVSVSTTFKITFANDSVFVTRATLRRYEDFFLNISTPEMECSVVPKQTVSIEALVDLQYLKGIAVDSCWLFKIGSGKINYYSPVPRKHIKYATIIQQAEGGPLVRLNSKTLAAMVDERYKKIHELIANDNLFKAVTEYNRTKD
jgi:hypothetical protein